MLTRLLTLFAALATASTADASRLVSVRPVDNRCLELHFADGEVEYLLDDTSIEIENYEPFYTEDWHAAQRHDRYVAHGEPLDVEAAARPESYVLRGGDGSTLRPAAVHRKTKVWEASITDRKAAMHHWVYLEFNEALTPGTTYTVDVAGQRQTFMLDAAAQESPAIKISNLGYAARAPHKVADVYLWKGDGGGHDFSQHDGATFRLIDAESGETAYEGKFELRMKHKVEPKFGRDFTMADIWQCDFSDFSEPGTYRLVIEGVGGSAPFVIGDDLFGEAFKVAMQGMFYQRMGCDDQPAGGFPKARRPLYKQGIDPEGFRVEISAKDMVRNKNPDDWKFYGEHTTGEVVPETWGGWADAYDNDQRPGNFVCAFDILLAYYLAPEAHGDSQLYIPEHGNGVPDVIDEALWEIDWWLRMRDEKGGYLTGLCNIVPPRTINYAGAPATWQGWCVAAGAAMAADCFRLAGNEELEQKYLDAALEAFAWAERQDEPMYDVVHDNFSGRDWRVTAAAFLFNLTGDAQWEQIVREEHVVAQDSGADVRGFGKDEQHFAAVAYVLSPHEAGDPQLQQRMREAIARQARAVHLQTMDDSPTLAVRGPMGWEGMMQTSNDVTLLAIAHRLSDDPQEKADYERGLYAEAEWTLGRNPLGLVQMTGLTDRAMENTFAPGRRDGAPGLTPGWTPYLCRDGWMDGVDIIGCDWYTDRIYPADKEAWAQGEHFWNTRYCVPHAEATPQQTFRQKIVLYGYLHALDTARRGD